MKEQENTKYKTTLCRNFEKMGKCPYKKKCQFAHGKGELQKLAPIGNRDEREVQKIPFWILKDVERLLS